MWTKKNNGTLPPLHHAIVCDDVDAVALLSRRSAACSEKNYLGLNALQLAKRLGKYDCIAILTQNSSQEIKIRKKESDAILLCSEKEFEELFAISYIQTPIFCTLPFLEQVISDRPWLISHTVFGCEHRRLGSALRSRLLTGYVANVSIGWINDEMGYGLFAEEDLPENVFIGQYCGIVRQVHRLEPELNEYCLHYPSRFFSYNYYVIDAKRAGNQTRFINHSDRANLQPMALLDRHFLHIGFFTSRACCKGEELTFNYGKNFWSKRRKA